MIKWTLTIFLIYISVLEMKEWMEFMDGWFIYCSFDRILIMVAIFTDFKKLIV